MVWVNIDTAEPKATLHANLNFPYVRRHSQGTALKGSGRILSDGGWMPFQTVDDARAYVE